MKLRRTKIVAFKTLDISQGSVATHLRCGGIFSDSIITNFLMILTVNNLNNRLLFGYYLRRTKIVPFLATLYGTEACPTNSAVRHSLDVAFNKVMFKIFGALSKDTYRDICIMYHTLEYGL